MNFRPTLLAALSLALASPALAAELPRARPDAVGLSAEKLDALKPQLQKLVDDGKLAGGVALIARQGKVAYLEAFGFRDLATKAPMTEDTIFAIASMSKPITCVAVMTLIEAGKLSLNDPVSKYLPELRDLRVLGDPKDDTDAGPSTVPAKRPVLVRDLLSHTSGIAYGGFLSADPRLGRAYDRAGVMGRDLKDLSDQVARLARVPLAHHPGDRWTYGLSHDVLGRLVEVVSGTTFDRYLDTHIFKPLDMRDTAFLVPEAKRDRVATIYRAPLLGGKLTPLPKNYGSATLFSGGGGLFSTARDYARFSQMLLDGGKLGPVRILSPEMVVAMTTNEIGDNTALGLFKYGLGFGLDMKPSESGKGHILKRYFWGGLFSTNFFIDPSHDLVTIIMTQVLPTNQGGAERILLKTVDSALQD